MRSPIPFVLLGVPVLAASAVVAQEADPEPPSSQPPLEIISCALDVVTVPIPVPEEEIEAALAAGTPMPEHLGHRDAVRVTVEVNRFIPMMDYGPLLGMSFGDERLTGIRAKYCSFSGIAERAPERDATLTASIDFESVQVPLSRCTWSEALTSPSRESRTAPRP